MKTSSGKNRLSLLKGIFSTIVETNDSFGKTGLSRLKPLFYALLLLGVFLYGLHLVSPLAPFVYSLF